MLKAKDQGHKCKCFPEKKGLKIFFSVDLKKKGLEKHFPADVQNFNHSKNNVVLEPRTKGGGGACHSFAYFSLLYILSWRPKGGAMAQCSQPKHAPGTAYQCERHKKKISFYNSQAYWK